MKYLSIQNLDIPCTFITGLSYAKQAETVQNARGYNRFQRMASAEISLRINVSRAVCFASNESFNKWNEVISEDLVTKGSEPTNAYLAGNPLYSELLFAITSINRTNVHDEAGELVSFECDFTLSGVSQAKDSSRVKALIFPGEVSAEVPELTISANGKQVKVDDKIILTSLILTEKGCMMSIAFQDGSKIVSRDMLADLIGDPDASVSINGYGDFHIVQADLIDDDLVIECSIFPIEWNQVETWSKISATIPRIFPEWQDDTNTNIIYIHSRESKISLFKKLENSLGLLADYPHKTFRDVPKKLSSNVDIQAYVDEDTKTEKITKLVWSDHVHQYTPGTDDGSCVKVDSCCVINDSSVAARCLRYAQFMQNVIKITIPYDKRIRLFSVINIMKSAKIIPAMVTHYEIDFMSNEMTIEAGYIEEA